MICIHFFNFVDAGNGLTACSLLQCLSSLLGHQHKIASLIHDALVSRGSIARIQQLPLPLTAAEASGTLMSMLHRVPSRLDVDAILHQAGMQMTAHLMIVPPPIAPQRIIRSSCVGLMCRVLCHLSLGLAVPVKLQ